MEFTEELKKRAIINSGKNKVENALYQIERMQANGTLDWYYVHLRDRLQDALDDPRLPLELLKDIMIKYIFDKNGKYKVHLNKGDLYESIAGSITLDQTVPNKMLEINHLYMMAKFEEPLPRKKTEALAAYFEVNKMTHPDALFPQNVVQGYVDDEGTLRISSKIATWDQAMIADALEQLANEEHIQGHYNGEDFIFEGIE